MKRIFKMFRKPEFPNVILVALVIGMSSMWLWVYSSFWTVGYVAAKPHNMIDLVCETIFFIMILGFGIFQYIRLLRRAG